MDEARAVPASWSNAESFYTVLGLSESASQDDIVKAYRRLARATHPDIQAGRENQFKSVQEAYDVLSRTQPRSRYNEHRQLMVEADHVRRTREAAAANAAARAAGEEQLRRAKAERDANDAAQWLSEAERRRLYEQEQLRRRFAVDDATRQADPNSFTSQFTFTFNYGDLLHIDEIRGQNVVVEVVGRSGFEHGGFSFSSPSDGDRIFVEAGLRPGRYMFELRGGFAPFGGRRGDLILIYSWPDPIGGADIRLPLSRKGRDRWRETSCRSPMSGATLSVPAGAGAHTLRYLGEGAPGEFGGPSGDLLIDIVFQGRPRGRLMHNFARAMSALGSFITGLLAVAGIALAVLLLLGLWAKWKG